MNIKVKSLYLVPLFQKNATLSECLITEIMPISPLLLALITSTGKINNGLEEIQYLPAFLGISNLIFK